MTFKHEQQIPPVIWAVVADRSRARILSAPWPDANSWEEVHDLVHGEGELMPREIDTDRPGSFASPGGGYHTGEDRKDFRHQSAEHFAAQIAGLLDSKRLAGEFGKLALVAPPLFLGVLRKELSSSLLPMVVLELHKEYTHDSLKDLAAHLTDAMNAQE
jgi:protein required for attachment to host cells